jgi:biotin carboxyl carrier protein
MRSMFTIGIQHPNRMFLGQWESVISAVVNAGVQAYRIHSEEERAEDERKFKEQLAKQAQAREAEALRIQQEAIKAQQAALQPPPATGPGAQAGAPGTTILGMPQGTFLALAGITAGTLLLGGFLLTRGKK